MGKENLDNLIPFNNEKINKGPVYKNDRFVAASMALKAGQTLPEHKTSLEALLVCVYGNADFILEGETISLSGGDFLVIPVGKNHSITAREETRLLIVK